jgi:hypothetical protein
MTQGALPFQYITEKNESNLTSFAVLPYWNMALASGLCTTIASCHILLNLVGGDCVDDIEQLEADEGLST